MRTKETRLWSAAADGGVGTEYRTNKSEMISTDRRCFYDIISPLSAGVKQPKGQLQASTVPAEALLIVPVVQLLTKRRAACNPLEP